MNGTNKVFDSAVAKETSPHFHGFPSHDLEELSSSALIKNLKNTLKLDFLELPIAREGDRVRDQMEELQE